MASAHTKSVMALYRRALKNAWSWKPDYIQWFEEMTVIRGKIEAQKHVGGAANLARLVAEGHEQVDDCLHPDPVIHPYAAGGAAWERNPKPGPWVLEQTPWEKEWFATYDEKTGKCPTSAKDFHESELINDEIEGFPLSREGVRSFPNRKAPVFRSQTENPPHKHLYHMEG